MRQSVALIGDPGRRIDFHIGDRENDIYEFFCAAQELGAKFQVRACVDWLAGQGDCTNIDEMGEVGVIIRRTVRL
jgi:hypothetical protein